VPRIRTPNKRTGEEKAAEVTSSIPRKAKRNADPLGNAPVTPEDIVAILKEEMQPALGCTEPSIVALACAIAYRAVGGETKKIKVVTDVGTFKNSFSCVIAGTDERGPAVSAALGVLRPNSNLKLEILRDVGPGDVVKARAMLEKGIVDLRVKKNRTRIYVEATVRTDKGVGRALIQNKHTNITLIETNGRVKYKGKEERIEKKHPIANLKVAELRKLVEDIQPEDLSFVLNAIQMNKELAQEALNRPLGIGAGLAVSDLIKEKKIADDLITSAQVLTACAEEARMGGAKKPAMSIAGSGSHGIFSTLPIAAVAERQGTDKERLARAIALSFLLTIQIKEHSGRLSAFCGCAVASGTGASAGIVYLLGGNDHQIECSIRNMAADITGIICDGANPSGCALKAFTGAGSAVRSALLAMRGITVPSSSGIVGVDASKTIENLGRISRSMVETDRTILDIMLEGK
jgi:L-cysteine desulfidase